MLRSSRPLEYQQSERHLAMDRLLYAQSCEDALDYWAGGAAQRAHLQRSMSERLGESVDPREPTTSDDARRENEDGKIIREGRTELYTVPYLRAIVESLAVLYSSDGLDRVYLDADEEPDDAVRAIVESYHARGWLAPRLQTLDAFTTLLRTSHLLVRWCPDLTRIVYDVIPPHWVWNWAHPSYPLETEMSYAVAYAEQGEPGKTTWTAYQRPPLESDPDDAPTRDYPRGRFVRWTSPREPFPIPDSGAEKILDEQDNPLVDIGGMDGDRLVWSPIVWSWAEAPTESVYLLPADDLVRANLEIDVALSMLLYVANMQSAGQPVLRGAATPPDALGPSRIVKIMDASGGFEFASPNADLSGHLTVIRQLLQIQSMLRHLAPDTYSLQRPSIQTGPAKLLEQNALVEARNRRTEVAERAESDRFDIERLYHNAYAPAGVPRIPATVRQSVRWGELRVPPDRAAQVRRLREEIEIGISTAVDAVMEVWGIDRAAALQKIAEGNGAMLPTTEPVESAIVVEQVEAAEPVEAPDPTEAVNPDTALNGAQVTALLEVVAQVVAGMLPRDSAVEIITASFPISRDDADRMLGTVGGSFTPAVVETAPAPGASIGGNTTLESGEDK
jgi:hypothetical protein